MGVKFQDIEIQRKFESMQGKLSAERKKLFGMRDNVKGLMGLVSENFRLNRFAAAVTAATDVTLMLGVVERQTQLVKARTDEIIGFTDKYAMNRK